MTQKLEERAGPFETTLTLIWGCDEPLFSMRRLIRIVLLGTLVAGLIRVSGIGDERGLAVLALVSLTILLGTVIEGMNRGRW